MVTGRPEALSNVRVVLVAPTHPGNIGAVARAMRTMGLSDLRLVTPRRFPSAEATERAAGAYDVLDRARVVDDLRAALAGCHWAVATTARPRRLEWTVLDPAGAGRELARRAGSAPVAVVFGRESAGLTNEEIDACQAVLRIPTAPSFKSLNIASAVQIVAYEIAQAVDIGSLASDAEPRDREGDGEGAAAERVSVAELEGLYAHFEEALIDIGYLDPAAPKLLMRRLRRLIARADIDHAELNILRGILKSAQQAAAAPPPEDDTSD